MKGSRLRGDFLAALSLANLSFIAVWDGLLNYTPAQAFFLEHAPTRTTYVATFANVILLGLVFFLFIRIARWIPTRFGTAGVLLGSVPILAIAALPAGKSIVRLIANRFPGWDLRPVVAALVLLFAVTVLVARRRFFQYASAALLTISPLILLEAVVSVSRCWTDSSAAYADGPLAARAQHPARPRVVWIIFDELDYRLAFLDRPSSVAMPAFDRLRAGSLFAENARSPARETLLSVPSLITGVRIDHIEPQAPRIALLNGVAASSRPTIFSRVHARGGNAAVAGWYIPYCRLYSQDLAACSSYYLESHLNEGGPSFFETLGAQQQSLFAYGNRSLLGESPIAKERLAMMNSIRQVALRDAADPSLDLVFLHLPVPHSPYRYDRVSASFPKRYLGVGTYLDNLALADVYLRDLRDAMTAADLWDTTTVLVSSDHPNRASMLVDGKRDPRVPFLLKMAGQTTGVTYPATLPTIATKPLLEAILDGEIHTSEQAIQWLTNHPQ